MLTYAFGEPASIVTRQVTGQDGDGNDVYADVDTPVTGAFAPAGSTEMVQGRQTVVSNPTFYLSPDSPVPTATARLRVRGRVYDIDGEPQLFRNPFTGDEPGAVLRLEEVRG